MGSGFLADSDIKSIFPTEVDKAEVPYQGRIATEHNMRGIQDYIGASGVLSNLDGNFVPDGVGGFKVTGNGGLDFQFTRGRCVVAGYYVALKPGANITQDKDSINFSVDANARSVIFLSPQIDPTTNNVSGTDSIEINVVNIGLVTDTVNIPNKSIPLAMLTADGAGITLIEDLRQSPMEKIVCLDHNYEKLISTGFGTPPVFDFITRGYYDLPVVNGTVNLVIRLKIKTGSGISGTKDIDFTLEGVIDNLVVTEQITLTANSTEEFAVNVSLPMGQLLRNADVGCTSVEVDLKPITMPVGFGSEIIVTVLG